MSKVQHVFIVGAKSLGAYGGYETFIDKLTEYHQNNSELKYHVACKANGDGCMDPAKTVGAKIIDDGHFEYHNADCFRIHVPNIGPAKAIYYDVKSLKYCVKYIKDNKIESPIVYILACRIGPYAKKFHKQISKLGGKLFVNPDGHEWMRAKWSKPVRWYWKKSEEQMVKHCDLLVCDSKNIEKYIHESYDKYAGENLDKRNPQTTFIAYGAETRKSTLADDNDKLINWYKEKGLEPNEYLIAA